MDLWAADPKNRKPTESNFRFQFQLLMDFGRLSLGFGNSIRFSVEIFPLKPEPIDVQLSYKLYVWTIIVIILEMLEKYFYSLQNSHVRSFLELILLLDLYRIYINLNSATFFNLNHSKNQWTQSNGMFGCSLATNYQSKL